MNYKQINLDTYNTISRDWDKKRKYTWEPVSKFLEDVSDKQDIKLLDLGCGTGRFLECARDLGFKNENLLGCDFSKRQLEITKQKGFETLQCELTKLPFEDSSFDIIICIATHHHILEKEEQLQTLKEMQRTIKKDGKILLSNWFPTQEFIDEEIKKKKFEFQNKQIVKVTYDFENKKYDRFYYFFEKEELKNLCKEAKLHIQKIYTVGNNIYLELVKEQE